jgi:hypothetical protein
VSRTELSEEIDRIVSSFPAADADKLSAMKSLIEQAAYETLYLQKLNAQAMETGLVEIHPEQATLQRALPVSAEIARHSAALTNIMDKLCKHLSVFDEGDDDDLEEFR